MQEIPVVFMAAVNLKVGGRWRLVKKIGAGSFGEIYRAVFPVTGEMVAVKLEKVSADQPQLLTEAKLYKFINPGTAIGVPVVHWYGVEGDYNVMVIDLLGPSLEDLFNFCNRKLSVKTMLMLGDQMVSRLEFFHSRDYIHRDIKPDNFLMGTARRSHHVYLIDFGLAKKYRDSKTHQHIPYRDGKSLTGTTRYCSANTHRGIEQARRDDVEGIAYVMIYLLQGQLPWQGIRARDEDEKTAIIGERKLEIRPEVLCRGLPREFAAFLSYARAIRFEDAPDYGYLKRLLRDLFVREGYQLDYAYDWTLKRLRELQRCKEGENHTSPTTSRRVRHSKHSNQ